MSLSFCLPSSCSAFAFFSALARFISFSYKQLLDVVMHHINLFSHLRPSRLCLHNLQAFCLLVDCHYSFTVVTSRTWRCKETTGRRKGIRRFWLHHRDRRHALNQTYNNCVETHLGGRTLSLLSLHWAPYCSLIAVAMSTTMMWPNAIPCVNGHVAKLFSMWKLQIQPVTDLCRVLSVKRPVYPECIVWATVYPVSYCVSCALLCILWATVH